MFQFHAAEKDRDAELYGATVGQRHFARLSQQVRTLPAGEIVIYDLHGVVATTASYLKASFLALLRASHRAALGDERTIELKDGGPAFDVFPMVANLSDDVREELDTLLHSHGLACLEAFPGERAVKRARTIGVLSPALQETLERVVKAREATATSLAEHRPPTINVTGWNNRLADLHQLRLVRREKQGRQWVYAPVVAEVTLG